MKISNEASTALNLYPGYINSLVYPLYPFSSSSIKAVSRALVAVVPTAKTLLPDFLLHLLYQTSFLTSKYSSMNIMIFDISHFDWLKCSSANA
jgi:hypothetical protein